MNKIVKVCRGRAMESSIKNAVPAIEDAILMAVERAQQIVIEVREKDKSVEFRAACDKILDRLREEY